MDSEKENPHPEKPTAIVALTHHGVHLALRLQGMLPDSVCYFPLRHRFALTMGARGFSRLGDVFPEIWSSHRSIVCIMATGIVIRHMAPLLRRKAEDPAVVVLDERGQFVISLLSGHVGGANSLARHVAERLGGRAVITTASDVQDKPAIDLIAREAGLEVEPPEMLPRIAMGLLEEEFLWIFDPENRLKPYLADHPNLEWMTEEPADEAGLLGESQTPGIWVAESLAPAECSCLALRPRNLVVGVGCNRGTRAEEILAFLRAVLQRNCLSPVSIRNMATIDVKSDEKGILEAAEALQRPISFYSHQEIEQVTVPNPSHVVAQHMGVYSVCEAAAILSAQSGVLLIPKQKSGNVTLAVARVGSPS